MLQQDVDAPEEYIVRYRREALDPSGNQTSGNAQEDAESVDAAFQDGDSRYDALARHSIHTAPFG